MKLFNEDNTKLELFVEDATKIATNLEGIAKPEDLEGIKNLIANFKRKTEDFYRENRKLNIGVIGTVKAGKSTFLNTLLFDGKNILPKASTPKTATLTKMEYSEQNKIEIEYYSKEEWDGIEENASIDLEDETFTSARELVEMVHKQGIEPDVYLEKGVEQIPFESYEDLMNNLNDYVGEYGRYTALVKSVTLYINREEFKGISIVDTPGLNDPIVSRTIRTKEFIEVCDVVFFLSRGSYFLEKNDWTLLSSQLPQKGVKKLVLIASMYDGAVTDVLKPAEEDDDIFGEDDSHTDNIPKACEMVQKSLKQVAKRKVEEFVKELKLRGSSQELIDVIQACADPLLVSSLAYNMSRKPVEEYDAYEKNVYGQLKIYSKDMDSDLKRLGNIDKVESIFQSVVEEKNDILKKKAETFVPNAVEELRNLLNSYKEKTERRLKVLEGNDKEQLLEQKTFMEKQMNAIEADIKKIFGELEVKLETERAEGVRELREESKYYLELREHSGSIPRSGSYTTGHFFWKKTHHYTYEEHYSYCSAADAVENLHKYSIDAVNNVEKVFTDALQLTSLKRNLLDVVVNNFDLSSEKFDVALFKMMVEETINQIEFPVFKMDISKAMNKITANFSGEITSAREKNELSMALQKAISDIADELTHSLTSTVKSFKESMQNISGKMRDALLKTIDEEFNDLVAQCENKEKEIEEYKTYLQALDSEIVRL